jgi:DNA-binding NtrC family response regulator
MTLLEGWTDMRVLLVGEEPALLEGLAQAFAAQGYSPRVLGSLVEAREAAVRTPPLLVLVDQALAADAGADAAAVAVAPGGALMLYRTTSDERAIIPAALQRLVLAELTLPLERTRLFALAQHVQDRVIATGRSFRRPTPPDGSLRV